GPLDETQLALALDESRTIGRDETGRVTPEPAHAVSCAQTPGAEAFHTREHCAVDEEADSLPDSNVTADRGRKMLSLCRPVPKCHLVGPNLEEESQLCRSPGSRVKTSTRSCARAGLR